MTRSLHSTATSAVAAVAAATAKKEIHKQQYGSYTKTNTKTPFLFVQHANIACDTI